jgi:hypothetical protein
LAELDRARASVDWSTDYCAIESEHLSRQVVKVVGILVDLGLLPIEDIPQLLKIAREVLPAVALILTRMQDTLASSIGPWG